MTQDEAPLNISANRSRRSTVKAVDYSKEQEFSDDDIFEDDLKQEKRRSSTAAKSRKSMGDDDERDVPERHSSRAPTVTTPSQYLYYEKGYDITLGHLRDRFTFMPELEADGSPKVDLIVGRRPIQQEEEEEEEDGARMNTRKTKKIHADQDDEEEEDGSEEVEEEEEEKKSTKKKGKRKLSKKTRPAKKSKIQSQEDSSAVTETTEHGHHKHIEYEYLVKYKGRSYLHLEWKKASDLESMNKSAKTLYRRFLKKLEMGTDENLEDPEIDPSFIQPQRILDEDEHEIMVDLSDKELVQWEKERLKQMEEDDSSDDDEDDHKNKKKTSAVSASVVDTNSLPETEREAIPDPGQISYEDMVRILKRDEPYYPVVQGSDNPYRDGYITEFPKKPRIAYLFFQCIYRAEYQRRFKGESVAEIMQRLGDAWRGLSEQEQAPFAQLAKEELAQYELHRSLKEKSQKPAEWWQPLRRCIMVLDRLSNDGYANIFLESVDLNEFTDYLEFVDQPIDLGTIRKKLETKKYMGPEQFARDMRKVWNNCKIYNQHGSAIWYVADYMSKQFERLYNAWVLEFRERYVRWADPKARPWEQTCRQCDGKCGTPDDKMVLCDHCDAMYGLQCLRPPLPKAPTGAWHCPDCAPKMTGMRGHRMLSALAENAARRRVELGGTPKKKIIERLFLVKWAGLSYEYCTWERQEDINDDALIAEFQGLSTKSPDEPTLTEDDVEKTLATAKHLTVDNAGGTNDIPRLRCQLYSQVRAFQFLKFGRLIPEKLALECGPNSKAFHDTGSNASYKSCNEGATEDEEQGTEQCKDPSSIFNMIPELPPLFAGEYDAIVPVTSKGLLMNVGEVHKAVSFLGYRQLPDGSKGPAERANLIRNIGDKIIAVDGVSAVNKSFKEVIGMLKEAGNKQFTHMRFLSSKYALSDSELTSMGTYGKFTIKEVKKYLKRERRLLLIKRNMDFDGVDESTDNDNQSDDESVETDEDSSSDESEFDDDDDDIGFLRAKSELKSEIMELETGKPPNMGSVATVTTQSSDKEYEKKTIDVSSDDIAKPAVDNMREQETTKSMAFRLLDIDIGYSSDEAGDENCAYFFDGVDSTFATLNECNKVTPRLEIKKNKKDEKSPEKSLPVKRSDFSALGDRAKLIATISLSRNEVDDDDFDNYPLPSSMFIESVPNSVEELPDDQAEKVLLTDSSPVKLSKTKIEQVSITNNEVIRVWASVEDASATLQISLKDMKEVLKGEYNEDTGEEVGGYKWRYAPENAEVTKLLSDKEKDKGKKAFYEFRDKLYDHEKPRIYKNGNRLRDYQIDGVNWLASCWYKRHGCILADEMGLGKTCQIVAYIEHLSRVENIRRPHLIVVPLSTVEHWRREIEAWTDLVCCVYHEQKRVWRDVMREYEWYYVDRPHTADFLKFDVLVTTYDTMIADFDVIVQIPWRLSVVDEAHRLRNQRGKLLECMREISGKGTLQYGFQSRILMTGTPLQNNIQELWTLLNFIEPFKFPSVEEFEASYGNMSSQQQVEALQMKISPFMLRRVKEDVAKDIPSKEETIIDVELTSIQKTYYRAIFERNLAFLNMGSARQSAPKLMNIQMELRKCCNHPFLLDGAEAREMGKYEKDLLESGDFYGKSADQIHKHLHVMGYIQTSGKMVLLDKLLPKLREEGHKILIFSQMVKMLDLLSEYFDFRNFKYERLDGKVRGNDRQKAIDRFNTQPDSFIFMLSTRAGGVGINLTAADIVIIFDSDWNPQNDIQAQARCHRIGQTKNVMIYRLITSRSFEQEMFDRASKKLGLEQAVLGTLGQDDDDGKPTAQEMEQLLKKGAYALLEDENDEITREFCADDIENILAKRTRTRVVEGTKTASWLNKQGLVTKSKFRADSNSAALDVDDPLFWQKVMPDFVTPAIMLKKLDDLECNTVKSSKVGRGRGRQKKLSSKDSDEDLENNSSEDSGESDDNMNKTSKQVDLMMSKSNKRLVSKFFQEMKSFMEGIFDDIEDGNLPDSEKAICQTLLLSVSVKAKIFSEEQRSIALSYLEKLEGGRRRKCRDENVIIDSRSKKGTIDRESSVVNDTFLIKSTKRRKTIVLNKDNEDEGPMDKDEKGSRTLDDDDYRHHSDSDEVWSEVVEDPYNTAQKSNTISAKEARRRRAWASDKDPAVAAGKPWPSLPRHKVSDVLMTLIDLIIQEDTAKGGLFSEPVPKDAFPEYYEIIQTPMDYGTIKEKIINGKYRSAQAMQKDLVLVTSNCLHFNSTDSDIVKEIKNQSLNRPNLLKKAAFEHNLFLAEDGSVLEILPEVKADDVEKQLKENRKKKKEKNEKSSAPGKIKINLKLLPASESTADDMSKAVKKRPKKSTVAATTSVHNSPLLEVEKPTKNKKATKKAAQKTSIDANVYLDQDIFERERSQLDGSIIQVRTFFIKRGKWKLPAAVEEKFDDVAKLTLSKVCKLDQYSLFTSKVNEDDAPQYYEIVENPMDFGTMRMKIENLEYGSGSNATALLYDDFLLVLDNCLLYNQSNQEVLDEGVRIFSLIPEMYASACSTVMKKTTSSK